MTAEKISPNPKEWRSWSKEQRQKHVHQFRIVTPQMRRLWDEFDTAAQMARRMDLPEPYYQLLIGASGTGKSTLVHEWQEHIAPDTPSLYINSLPPDTLKWFLARGLSVLGDPHSSVGTTASMANRFVASIKAAEKHIIFVDDVQHVIERSGTPHIPPRSADILSFLLHLSNDLNLPLVLIGLPAAQVLLQVSPQWERRLDPPRVLNPYDWDITRPETIRSFCRFIDAIDRALPLDQSDLGTEEMAARFFFASDGLLSQVMRLVRRAALQAIEREEATRTLEGLAGAYEYTTMNSFRREKKPNPFREPLH
jgi:GTPase SAR1 family protein